MNETIMDSLKQEINDLEKWLLLYKAEADGKTIQISNKDQTKWSDWNKPMYTEDIINYRIKPESIYYYQWERLVGNQIVTSEFTTENLIDMNWIRLDSSKRIWKH